VLQSTRPLRLEALPIKVKVANENLDITPTGVVYESSGNMDSYFNTFLNRNHNSFALNFIPLQLKNFTQANLSNIQYPLVLSSIRVQAIWGDFNRETFFHSVIVLILACQKTQPFAI
jgi:hypothetical protein